MVNAYGKKTQNLGLRNSNSIFVPAHFKLSKQNNANTLFRPEQILEKKSALFSVVVAGVVGILAAPVILPHAFHGFHIAHILLHVGGITLASFLTILSTLAYFRIKSKRLMITTFAFSVFILAEIITLVDATWPHIYDIGDLALLEIGHLMMITSLGLLAIGVFRND